MGSRFTLLRPGLVEYEAALAMQHRTADIAREGGPETLILLEHPPTYTLGARGRESHLLAGAEALRQSGAHVTRTDRGGDVTFHGPGQIVGYPIMRIRERGMGPATYVRLLEQVMIDALNCYGIAAVRVAGRPGAWVDGNKIGAVGVRVSAGVTTHGFALNVQPDLAYFEEIIPCGIADAGVTSMRAISGHAFAMDKVADAIVNAFERLLAVEMQEANTMMLEAGVGR